MERFNPKNRIVPTPALSSMPGVVLYQAVQITPTIIKATPERIFLTKVLVFAPLYRCFQSTTPVK